MQSNQFTIRSRRGTVVLHLLLGLLTLALGILVVLASLAGNMDADDMMMGFVALSFGIGFTYRGICLLIWKCTVEDNNISFRSLFRRKTILVSDIKRVTSRGQTDSIGGSNRSRAWNRNQFVGIDLYSETGKLFHIHGTKEGFRAFITYLEEWRIPGVETLPTGIRWR